MMDLFRKQNITKDITKVKYKIQFEKGMGGSSLFYLYKEKSWGWSFIDCSDDFSKLTEAAAKDANPDKPVVVWTSEIEVKK